MTGELIDNDVKQVLMFSSKCDYIDQVLKYTKPLNMTITQKVIMGLRFSHTAFLCCNCGICKLCKGVYLIDWLLEDYF